VGLFSFRPGCPEQKDPEHPSRSVARFISLRWRNLLNLILDLIFLQQA
jgi:hypothetical protein